MKFKRIDKIKFYNEIEKYYEMCGTCEPIKELKDAHKGHPITDILGHYIVNTVNSHIRGKEDEEEGEYSGNSPDVIDDIHSVAVLKCIKTLQCRKFNLDNPSKNPFGYFTTVAVNAINDYFNENKRQDAIFFKFAARHIDDNDDFQKLINSSYGKSYAEKEKVLKKERERTKKYQ